MAKSNLVEAKPNTIVTGTTIKGDVTASGDFRIDGTLIGSIKCKGKIVIGETGTIEGEIECQNADFSGSIKAKDWYFIPVNRKFKQITLSPAPCGNIYPRTLWPFKQTLNVTCSDPGTCNCFTIDLYNPVSGMDSNTFGRSS